MAIKVFNLRCAEDHRFEGWFTSEDDYTRQVHGGLLTCPMCGTPDVSRAPSAPYVSVSGPATEIRAGHVKPTPEQMQAMFVRFARELAAGAEDVGERFAEEARKIHHQEAPERSIRGVASRDEAEALEDEGISVLPLPYPGLLKEPLQ